MCTIRRNILQNLLRSVGSVRSRGHHGRTVDEQDVREAAPPQRGGHVSYHSHKRRRAQRDGTGERTVMRRHAEVDGRGEKRAGGL